MSGDRVPLETLVGNRVLAVTTITLSEKNVFDRDSEYDDICLFLEDGRAFRFHLEGDCCSRSAFTPDGAAAFKELIGAMIQSVEHSDGTAEDNERVLRTNTPGEEDSWHFLVFTTDKGHVTVDWRNVSNGYYDGWCDLIVSAPLTPAAHDMLCALGSLDAVRAALPNHLITTENPS